MPSLNRDILFAIGKKIVEDGDSDALIRFALSGRRHLAVLPHVFASVTTLKLFKHSCEIGWGDKCSTFNYQNNEIPLKFLLHQAGNYIETLHIEERIPIFRLYEPIIDKMFDNKQLISFSVGTRNDKLLIDALLDEFASTLKNVTVPYDYLKSEFRGKLILDSLNVMDFGGASFFSFSGKTSSLTFPLYDSNNIQHYEDLFSQYHDFINPAVLPVKELIFEDYISSVYYATILVRFQSLMQCFHSLELFKLNITVAKASNIKSHVLNYTQIIKEAIKVPSKVLLKFYVENMQSIDLDTRKNICINGFEFDESAADLFCCRKTIQSADSKSTILEVQVSDNIFDVLYN